MSWFVQIYPFGGAVSPTVAARPAAAATSTKCAAPSTSCNTWAAIAGE